ncbi:hypothetical protein AAG906_017974 [Vitis piasezkii]
MFLEFIGTTHHLGVNCGTQRSDKVGSDKVENSHNSCYNSGETLKDVGVSMATTLTRNEFFYFCYPNFLLCLNRGRGPLYGTLPSNNHDFPFTQCWKFYYSQTQPHKLSIRTIRTFKSLCNSLAAIGKPVLDKEKVFSLIKVEIGSQTVEMPPMHSPSNGLLRTATTKISTILHRISRYVNYYSKLFWFDSVLIGDGSSLPILGIGDSSIKCKGDLYVLPNLAKLYFSHRFKSSSIDIWHQPFEQYVNRQFNKKIKVFHLDGGGEFINFNGAPLFLWVEAFSTAIYLINRLPSSALNSETPYFALHGTHPDYTSLRVFGSKCFPYTWDTRQHKFDPKTVLCVFVGYSDKHKGYKCFHPSSRKIFISRHVNQSIVPHTSHVISIFDSWLPHTNSTHSVEIESQTLTPPCTSPLPTIPLLTSVSNSITGFSSNMHGSQQLGTQLETNQPPQTQPSHSMITRSQRGIIKPNPKYALASTIHSTNIPREPHNIRAALAHPGWKASMDEELEALHKNKTWVFVPRTSYMHVIGSNGYSNQNSNPMVH